MEEVVECGLDTTILLLTHAGSLLLTHAFGIRNNQCIRVGVELEKNAILEEVVECGLDAPWIVNSGQ